MRAGAASTTGGIIAGATTFSIANAVLEAAKGEPHAHEFIPRIRY
jgi:hypothetical protein